MSNHEAHLGWNVKSNRYVTSRYHQYLDEGAWREEGGNIGINGEHLTISFLSLNRSELSKKLCRSIAEHMPNFKGEVLIIDNGSTDDEIENLERYLAGMPFRWRVERLGQNFGVAGGRNRTMPFVQTPWVMMLDNDIYLLKNPLRAIQADLASLGCHFLSLTLLNDDKETTMIRGGNIYLDFHQNELIIGGGSAYLPSYTDPEGPGFLGTFMPGGAAVFRKDSFLALGGYDEGMFVGFEDTEFSLRLFRAGMKVGASDERAFVHDHPKPTSNDDIDYERARFARKRLEDSATYFEKKHGFKVWNSGVEIWLAERERELGLDVSSSQLSASQSTSSAPGKPRIALVADTLGWALGNVATQLRDHLSDEFEIALFATEAVHPAAVLHATKNFDLVHFLWREPLQTLTEPWAAPYIDDMFGGWEAFASECVAPRPITATVFDHLFLSDRDVKARRGMYNELLSGYTVSSQILCQLYAGIESYPEPSAVTPDGVDLRRFKPSNLGRFLTLRDRPIRIGWAGNSAFGHWNEAGKLNDHKGFHTVLKPAIAQLRFEGFLVEEFYADKQIRSIPHHRMNDYYNSIDLLICCSESEGTPNPVLEAMACGVPTISTKVGIVPEAFGDKQRRFILDERTPASLTTKIAELIATPHLMKELSEENLQSIKRWDWSRKVDAYRRFFNDQLSRNRRTIAAIAHAS